MTTLTPSTPIASAPTPVSAAPPANCPVLIDGHVRIPAGITDLESFRQWAHSDDFPQRARIAYLDGTIWVDLSMEQMYTHNQVKGEVGRVLGTLVRARNLGRYMPDGMRLSNGEVNLSTEPDGMFATYDTLRSGRVRQVPNVRNVGVVELVGTPDMVLEVVSDHSVTKDTIELPPLYERAGIAEFWRIDVRTELLFEILRLTPNGWVATKLPDDWWRSEVFGHDFCLHQAVDPLGQPEYTLDARPSAS